MLSPSPLLRWSNRCYRLLLLAYPAEFRDRHGQEMIQTFRDCCRAELADGGNYRLLRFWGLVLSDFLLSVSIEQFAQLKKLLSLTKEQSMVSSPFLLQVAQNTDIGLKREKNEDALISVLPEDVAVLKQKGALFVVADGMGGHKRGDMASEQAVNSIRERYYQDEGTDNEAALQAAFKYANKCIQDDNASRDQEEHMYTTAVAMAIRDEIVSIANIGDSLVYLVRDGQVSQLAESHAWVDEQMRAGLLTREEARTHEKRNIVTRCLGMREPPDVEVYTASAPIQRGDVLVLCTDGLYQLVSEEEISKIVETHPPEESTRRLIALANEKGGPDNITALVVQVA
jgi:serine/threonine protein phosphatase PrpC